jgi:DNA-binding beta-propeller fold protein YncE
MLPESAVADGAYGQYLSTLSGLSSPGAAMVDAQGRVLVCEPHHRRVRIVDAAGASIGFWMHRDGDGMVPAGIASGEDGQVFITDSRRSLVIRVEHMGLPAERAESWGDSFLRNPQGLAVHGDRVYIADTVNDCVRVTDFAGNLLRSFGNRGKENGEFRRPMDLAVDDAGFIYVADCDNHRVQKFREDGTFVMSFGDWGAFPGLFSEPSGIEHYAGRLYVADRLNHRIEVFDLDGEFLYQWGMHAVVLREGDGKIHYPNAIAMHPNGEWAVVCESFENRCQLFGPTADGAPLRSTMPQVKEAQSHFGPGIAAADGRLAVWEAESRVVYVFDTQHEIPILISQFGQPGDRPADLAAIASMQFLPGGERLALSNTTHRSMQVFDIPKSKGELRFDPLMSRFVKAVDWGARSQTVQSAHAPALSASQPTAVLARRAGGWYLLDARGPAVFVFDSQFNVVDVWQWDQHAALPLERPIAAGERVDGSQLLVVDAWARCVHVFNADGTHASAWTNASSEGDAFVRPVAIAVGADGMAYVVDAELHAVIVLDSAGRFVRRWGSLGMGAGDFYHPWGIAIDGGRVFVLDHGNHRVQIFDTQGDWGGAFSAGTAYTQRRPVPQWMEDWRPDR